MLNITLSNVKDAITFMLSQQYLRMAPEEQVQCRFSCISIAVFSELIQLCLDASEHFGATFHLLWNEVTGPQTKWV